ncbi:MAG: PQQ-binding-like beta-propeller repeat protein [Filimonas sp.]|nr:PQQ-binding-like beta-propeller repeat protein [Filimonas sp.]
MKKILLSVGLLISAASMAQRQADKVITFDQNIDNIVLHPLTGQVILKEKEAIISYNPETKQQDWKVTKEDIGKLSTAAKAGNVISDINSGDLSKLFGSADKVSFISESPYIRAIIDNKDVIINSFNGKVLFNSATKNYRIVQSENLPREKKLLFVATDNKKMFCILYDLETSTEIWTTELASVESFMKQFSLSFNKGKAGAKDKLISTDQDIYTSINARLYKLDKTSGKLYWSTDFDLTNFFISQSDKNIIITKNAGGLLSSKQAVNVIDASNGSLIWKDDITGKYISYIEDWNDRILIAYSKGFNFYNYNDGKKTWKKDAKGDDIKKVIPIDMDYLYISDKDMNLINNNGESQWKKTIEICDKADEPVYYLGKVDNNRVFYLTATLGNMVDYSSGKKIWKKNIEFDKDRALLYSFDETSKSFIVFNDKKLYKFDPNSSDKPEYFVKLKDLQEDKSIEKIDLFDWGVCLVGQSDVIGVGFDGQVKYHNVYKEPGAAARKLLKTGAGITSAYFAVKGAVQSAFADAELTVIHRDAQGKTVQESQSLLTDESKSKLSQKAATNQSVSTTIDASVSNKVRNRFNALKHSTDYAFVLARGEGDETTQLVKVRKSDGVEIDKISIDNNKPLYEIDPVTNDIYYIYKNELRIFSKQ